MLPLSVKDRLHSGAFIPAHPLALTSDKNLDEKSQRALTRYYIEAGVGGLAVGVHTTQFEIRNPEFNLYEKVLQLAMEEMKEHGNPEQLVKVAGICGHTEQAAYEAEFSKSIGYDLGLLSFRGLDYLSEDELIKHVKEIAEIIPIFGFYLQPAVGGRVFSYEFWKEFTEIPNVHAIKIAPFNRYFTLDVVRAVCHSSRNDEIALYTGNDDNIINDLLTTYAFKINNKKITKNIVGGLLGHWSVWVKKAVEIFEQIKKIRKKNVISSEFLTLNEEITDVNSAFFDAANDFKGSIAGINEVLHRQGLLQGNWCLSEKEKLSPGQSEEIDRVIKQYPHLSDDKFIKENLKKWFEI